MQMFINSFKVNRGFRPLSSTNKLYGHLASINRDLSLPTDQTSQSIRPTGHNEHAQRKERNIRTLPRPEEHIATYVTAD